MNSATTVITDWGVAVWTAFAAGMVTLLAWVPKLIGALVILAIGWAIGAALYSAVAKLLRAVRFDGFIQRHGISALFERVPMRSRPSEAVATVVKWVVILVTISVAADTLGLPALTTGIGAVLAYVPNVLAAVVIMGLGLALASFVRDLAKGLATSARLQSAETLGTLAYWGVTCFAILGAIAQLNIAATLVQTLYTGVIAAASLAAGLAFGLGLREQARDTVAGRAIAERLRPGDDIIVGDVQGKIQHIGAVATTIVRPDDSTVTLPNRELLDQRVTTTPGSGVNQRLRVTFSRVSEAGGQPQGTPERGT